MRGIRRSKRLASAGALGVALVVGMTACAEDPKPVYQKQVQPAAVVTQYDSSLKPSAAVLALVPEAATALTLTDFDQLRLVLGFGSLNSRSPAADRDRWGARFPKTAALTDGLLRPQEARLRDEFRISQDDVAWEARYQGPDGVRGWILAFQRGTSMPAVGRAVKAEVGVLKDAVVDADRLLVFSAAPPEPAAAWGAHSELVELTGTTAVATYVERSCLPFETVFGAGMKAQLAAAPAAELRSLDELTAFAVQIGGELATVQLGSERSDAFDRARLAELMPPTTPDFSEVMTRAVADPSTGRLGYTVEGATQVARLVRERRLPPAVCAD